MTTQVETTGCLQGRSALRPFSSPKGHRNDLIFEANDVVTAIVT